MKTLPANQQIHPLTSFKGVSKTAHITTEKLQSLISSGKTVREIKTELGIATDTYYKLLRERGISYNRQAISNTTISKSQIETFLQNGIPIPKICEALKITESKYYTIIEHLGIKHPIKAIQEHLASITQAQLKNAINSCSSVDEICKSLNINSYGYYSLLKKFNLTTPKKKVIEHNSTITKEQILNLINENKKTSEIIKTLRISQDTYNKLIKNFGITTKAKFLKQNISNITKEKLQSLVDSGKPVKEICKELNIPERSYTRLLDKFQITTARKSSKKNIANITAEKLQELVNQDLSINEICNKLKIDQSMFYKLLKRLNIDYNYLHHYGEIKISRQRLLEITQSGLTTQEISNDLGVAVNTYHEKAKIAKVKTVNRNSIDLIASIPIEEFQESINSGMSVKELCKKYNITKSTYYTIIRKYNLSTPQKEAQSRISKITTEQLEELKKSGKTREEICKELNISQSTFTRLLHLRNNNFPTII
ncbi:hypothetical protein HDR58_01310 [bacterium]|nr:hypothetical protein [bacterium]